MLLAIIFFGVFLRTYHFRDWLTFNPDQARDAALVDDVLAGKSSWIMLGPEAGNTHFNLGPWFYHLEILSAKIFGASPWQLAYPDLFFSILTIPLLYLFAKKYFTQELSLLLTFLLSLSYFMITYARFAFNPNSIPFFVLLFLLGILSLLESGDEKWWSAVLVGIAVGVGIQLHAILIFTLPILTVLTFLYLAAVKKMPVLILLKKGVVILFFVLLANTSQFIYNFTHGNSNANKFKAAFSQNAGGGKLMTHLEAAIFCQSTANLHILTSLGTGDKCDTGNIVNSFFQKNKPFKLDAILLILCSLIFTLGGYGLLVYFWKQETNTQRKDFLMLICAYATVTFLVMVPIIDQASIRYYIVLFFLPFVFAGLWLEFLWKKNQGKLKYISLGIATFLIILLQFQTLLQNYQAYTKMAYSDTRSVSLREAYDMTSYIISGIKPPRKIYLDGDSAYFSRYYKPFYYLAAKAGVEIIRAYKEKNINPNVPVIFLEKPSSDKQLQSETHLGRSVFNYKLYKNMAILKLNN